MPYYSMDEYKLKGFEVSKVKDKMYNAVLVNKKTKREKRVPFGSRTYKNYRDATGLNAYPNLIHGDKERRKRYHQRHEKDVKEGYYSPGYFSLRFLW
jgi:hypothetical protein